jgi:hypothetical protein
MKIKDYIFFVLILAGVVFFFQWRISKMQDKVTSMNTDIDNQFKTLNDGVSAKSQVNVVAQPNLFDKIFNTALNKQYEEIKKMIPDAVRQEMKNLKIENSTTTITKSSFVIQGDSALFLNKDGIITKVAKVQPINEDSSLLIIVPQEIELTTVQANYDPNDNTKVQVFVTAINKTTGDTLKIDKSLTSVLPGKQKKWNFSYKPYIGLNYDLINGGIVGKAGIDPIVYNSKKVRINMFGLEIRQNLKNQNSFVDLKLLQLQLK